MSYTFFEKNTVFKKQFLLVLLSLTGGGESQENPVYSLHTPEIAVLDSDVLSLNKLCLKPNGQFPGKNCNSYVNCWDGFATDQTCSKSLVFNPKGFCDYPENVNCNEKPPTIETSSGSPILSTTPPTFPPSLAPGLPPINSGNPAIIDKRCLNLRGQFPADSCEKYVNCWDGVAVEQECPEGLLFSMNKGYCDFPQNVKCNNKEAPTEIPATVSTNPQNTEKSNVCPLQFGTFRDIQNCGIYFTCVSGKVVSKYSCPEGLSFNENIGVCDWNYRVHCSTKLPVYQPNRATTLKPSSILIPEENKSNRDNNNNSSNEICPSEFGTFRSKSNCKSYFTCISGRVVAKYNCPEGLSFSKKLGVCDWNSRVDCKENSVNNRFLDPRENFFNNIPPDALQKLDRCKTGTIFRLNPQCTTAGICRDSLIEIIQCPNGLAYDSITDKCLPVSLAKC